MLGEFKVYKVEDGYQIFWCPSAPMHYQDRIPHDGRIYTKKQAAYRRAKQLTMELAERRKQETALV